eukprot:scaffold173460_cov26-Prasinocladus_malaysianus.AAC.1
MQEPAGDVPQGSVPRTLTVHIKGELTRTVKPGEMVTLSGIFLPVPFTGYKVSTPPNLCWPTQQFVVRKSSNICPTTAREDSTFPMYASLNIRAV